MRIPFLDLKVQYRQIEAALKPVLEDIMVNGAFIGGPQVEAFEREFAAFCGGGYCVGLNSGTDALRFALMAADIRPGDEVITVPHTFIATTEAISQAGATPAFVDIDPATCCIDVNQIQHRITSKTRAMVPVHLYGQPADMDPILEIARKHHLAVIEDACQAHGALYKGHAAGSMGTAGCFSFYPGKNLGAFGDAGAVVTGDDKLAQTIRMLREHGQSRKYYHDMEGYTGRLDAIQAAVLRPKLKRLKVGKGIGHRVPRAGEVSRLHAAGDAAEDRQNAPDSRAPEVNWDTTAGRQDLWRGQTVLSLLRQGVLSSIRRGKTASRSNSSAPCLRTLVRSPENRRTFQSFSGTTKGYDFRAEVLEKIQGIGGKSETRIT